MTERITVYAAIKKGMDANPDIIPGRSSTYVKVNDTETCCAIGFIALGQCSLDDWRKLPFMKGRPEGTLSASVGIDRLLYSVLDPEELPGSTVYSWNDAFISKFEDVHHRPPTQEEFLTALREQSPALAGKYVSPRSCDLVATLPDWQVPS